MDNFQSHLFTASQRLNDLTGYSGIEALKNDISAQEDLVSSSRKAVNEAREKYAAAIATRSTTQREVNDLLHRKHAWSSVDLERFTSLYRSDHANEQAEVAAQKKVGDAETRYEEASTKLARTILARYHEEQIWSDKIRQMSTWGTWGLMGLNVLLFVVFQIMVEPWRRKRLVKGFEDKVEVALRERDTELQNALKYGVGVVRPNGEAAIPGSSDGGVLPVEAREKVDGIADHLAEQIVDAISGTTATPSTSTSDHSSPSEPDSEATSSPLTHDLPTSNPSIQPAPAFPSSSSAYASYEEAFRELFSERKLVVTQKEMTTVALEGAVGGAAVMGLVLVLLRPR
jgi:sensitive to high expression protein 9, mitochondrial